MSTNCVPVLNKEIIQKIINSTAKKTRKTKKQTKFSRFTELTVDNIKLITDLFSKDKHIRKAAQYNLEEKLKGFTVTQDGTKQLLGSTGVLHKVFSEEMLNKLLAFDMSSKDISIKFPQAMIILDLINSSIETESALYEKYPSISEADIEAMRGSTDVSRLYSIVGRVVLESNGQKLIGDLSYAHESYALLGKQVLDGLANEGLFSIEENTLVVNPTDLVNTDGEMVESTKSRKERELLGRNTRTGTSIRINDDVFKKLSEDNDISIEFSQLQKLLSAIETKKPGTESSAYDHQLSDIDILGSEENQKKIKQEISKLFTTTQGAGFTLNPMLIEVLKELKKVVDANPNKRLKNVIDDALRGRAEEIFGFDLFTSYEMEIYRESRFGKELSKVSPLKDLLENIETYEDSEVFYKLFLARNSRTHVYESFLNPQTDKFISRWVVAPSKKTTYTSDKDKELLINSIAKSLQISVAEVTGEVDTEFNDLIESYEKLLERKEKGTITSTAMLTSLQITINKLNKKGAEFNGKRFWEVMSMLDAVVAVRKAGKGPVTTNFSTEEDASASGILIKMLYALSDGNPAFREILEMKKAGEAVEKDVEGAETSDAYRPGQNKIEEILNIDENEASEIDLQDRATMKVAFDLLGYGTDKARDLLKIAIMTFSYGQSRANNKIELGKEIANVVLVKGTKFTNMRKIANEVLAIEGLNDKKVIQATENFLAATEDVNVFNNSLSKDKQKEIRRAFIAFVGETTGETLVSRVLEEVYSNELFGSFDTDMKSLYEILSTIVPSTKDIQIPSPLDLVFSSGIDGNILMKLSKLKETLTDVEGIGETIFKYEHINEISAKVIPVHATDSAVLLMTLRDYYADQDIDSEIAIQLIHDAVRTSPTNAAKFAALYEKNLIKVTYAYDPRTAMVDTINRVVKESSNPNIGNIIKTEKVQKLLKKVKETVQSKQEALNTLFDITVNEDGTIDVKDGIPYSFRTNYKAEIPTDPVFKIREKKKPEGTPTAEMNTEDILELISEQDIDEEVGQQIKRNLEAKIEYNIEQEYNQEIADDALLDVISDMKEKGCK